MRHQPPKRRIDMTQTKSSRAKALLARLRARRSQRHAEQGNAAWLAEQQASRAQRRR